ncbi:MAG: GNAT family N-acetyltransferase, partial [Candidatus Magasanikbacteria bacterium]|nr:GNAT family N-acetyltransferase [Candidatus Magasanikbacteria bacterium]
PKRPGQNHVPVTAMRAWLEEKGAPAEMILVDDAARNTREQAEYVLELAASHGWHKVMLVGSRYHQARAFLTFLKRAQEIGWSGELLNQGLFQPWFAVPSGQTKTVAELFQEEKEKLIRYRDHVASVAEGAAALEGWLRSAISFREATFADAPSLFRWRNDPVVYARCLVPRPVDWTTHVSWLQASLADPHRFLFIAENGLAEAMGQVRFDVRGAEATIHVSLGEGYRGHGFGQTIIREASRNFLARQMQVRRIVAEILPDHQASRRTFTNAGYRRGKSRGAVELFFYEL